LSYVFGTFLVTGLGNVPLNNQLASISVADARAARIWEHYLDRWTRLNTIRTGSAAAATLLFTLGLIQDSSG